MSMKTRFGNRTTIATIFLAISLALAIHASGQVTMGILPVIVPASGSSGLNEQQLQNIPAQLHDYLVTHLNGIGDITKLSREHILLLTKEMSSQAPENLDIEAYKQICRKEKLDYLLKCTVESIHVSGKIVNAPVHIIIIDGSNGKLFWEKTDKTVRATTETPVTGEILVEQVLKPALDELIKEISKL